MYIPHGLETPIVIGKPAPFVSTFVDAVDAALCANRQVLQALRILELVQFVLHAPGIFTRSLGGLLQYDTREAA